MTQYEICDCCGKPKRPKGVKHPSPNCPVYLLDRQSGVLQTKGPRKYPRTGEKQEGWGNIGTKGEISLYGDKGGASRFFHNSDWQLENAEPIRYQAKASRKERDAGLSERNGHPTLKPIALTRWLATLLLPPEEYAPRRLLIPFGGTLSEGIGAYQAGWDEILAIEMMAEYVEIAEARLAYWMAQAEQLNLL